MQRNQVLAIAIGAVVATAATGWFAGQQIASPAEVAARTSPLNASRISVPVAQLALASEVVTRGTVRYGSPQPVSLPVSPLKPPSRIVTSAPVKGAALSEGSVAMTLSGRPVFVLQGAQPAARDLGPGAQGPDVMQLEEGLARLGFNPGKRDGTYDANTANAVAAWYRAGRWTPFGPTDEQRAALRAAQADLYGARSDGLSAEDFLSAARATHATAAADVVNKNGALAAAVDAHRVAQLELDEARSAVPPKSPAEIAAADAKVRQAAGAVASAQAGLDAANASATQAAEAVLVAERRVGLTASRGGEVGSNVNEIAGKLGIQVPADEMLFYPTLPVRVDDVTLVNGQETTGPVMTVSRSQLSVEGALSINDAKLVRAGAAVAIEDRELGVRASGTVTAVADTPGTQGVDPQRFYLQVTPTDLPASLVGSSVVVTITVESTSGTVLAVPVAALSVAANGDSRVQVTKPNGSTRTVTVTPGLAAKGLVAVTPIKGRLAPGDLVIVGKGGAAAGSTPTSDPPNSKTTTTTSSSTTTSTANAPGVTNAP